MKLFKNGVGRPSNAIKKMRKIVMVSTVVIVILIALVLVLLLCKPSILTSDLKKAAAYSVSYGLLPEHENDVKINYLSIEDLTEKELDTLYTSLGYFQENETGIPMIIVVKNKQVLDSSLENLDKEGYIEFFKKNNLM